MKLIHPVEFKIGTRTLVQDVNYRFGGQSGCIMRPGKRPYFWEIFIYPPEGQKTDKLREHVDDETNTPSGLYDAH